MSTQMNPSQIAAAQRIGLVVLESIQEAGNLGAPAGVLYAALASQGCTLNQFQSLMAPLEAKGFVTRESDCYTLSDAGAQFIGKLRRVVEARRG